jgi:two-component system, LuxR family, sensor kinase FixL
MNPRGIHVLLIEDNPGDARLVREVLSETPEIEIHVVDRISLGVEYLTSHRTDVVLLDLGLPDSQGLDSLHAICDPAPHIPVVVLTGHDDEEVGRSAIRQGAQDYLVKPVISGRLLARVLRFAVERKGTEETLKKKDEELRMLSQQLLQAEKLATMGELAASMAHELNNPLATVSLRIESLQERMAADNPDRRYLEIIEKEIERMATLIANLLQFSRRGKQQISTVDICEEIENTLEFIHYHLRNHNISIMRQFGHDVPRIHADRQQLQQLFLNLFTNAVDAMPDGGMLTIVVAINAEGKKITIEIADTGTGIPPELLKKVTEPFFTTKPEGRGTGLGLSICQRIVKEHLGTIEIMSDVITDKGTRVYLTLPFLGSNTVNYLPKQ